MRTPQELCRAAAAAWLVARAAPHTPTRLPRGQCRLSGLDATGVHQQVDLLAWRRLDRGPWPVGTLLRVDVQGRAGPGLHLPLHGTHAWVVLTLNPADQARVVAGAADG